MGLGFELVGGEVSEGVVFALMIVVAFDVFEEFQPSIRGIFKTASLKHLALEGAHEGFRLGVIIRIGPCGHALAQTGTFQNRSEGTAAILAAAVAMEDGSPRCWPRLQGLLQGMDDEFRTHVRGQIPTHDAARAKINDHSEVSQLVEVGMKVMSPAQA
jgi:hypothetical protein